MSKLTFGSLFAGIGGMDLGLEKAGMTCAWQVENDPWATRVLAKHWSNVRRWDDVRTFPPMADTASIRCPKGSHESRDYEPLQSTQERGLLESCGATCEWSVDLICGGFPCQDISYAGKGAGLTG